MTRRPVLRTLKERSMKNNLTLTLLVLLSLFTGCRDTCDVDKQREAWKAYDAAITNSNAKRYDPQVKQFAFTYSSEVVTAMAERNAKLDECFCDHERPEMSEKDVELSKANLRNQETRLLINVCTHYNLKNRSVGTDGRPEYYIDKDGKRTVVHPMYNVFSNEAFDSLLITIPNKPDPTLPDSIKQPDSITVYRSMPAHEVLAQYGPFALEPQYRLFYNYDGPLFLSDVEKLHNDASNWTNCGMSSIGRKHVLDICSRYNLNTGDVMDALNVARAFCGE